MSPASLVHPDRKGCAACPSDENAVPGPNKSTPSHAYGSRTAGRTLGRRSLDAFSSLKGSLVGRQALNATANHELAATPALESVSVGSSPVGPTKQKWYDSLRGRSSQIPTPSSPTSMSSTLKRSRFFRLDRSKLAQPLVLDPSPDVLPVRRAPLPKLEILSLQSDLQRMSIFGELTEQSFVEPDQKPVGQSNMPNTTRRVQADMTKETESKPKETAMSPYFAASSSGTTPQSSSPSELRDSEELSFQHVALGPLAQPDGELLVWCIVACDLFYKGSPWEPEYKRAFSDATSALADHALRHMLSDSRRYSDTLLWTAEREGYVRGKKIRASQAFTVYPPIDGPRRIELAMDFAGFDWAIITFTKDAATTQITDLEFEDERLRKAVRSIIAAGYRVDVWTAFDDRVWKEQVQFAESEYRRVVTDRLAPLPPELITAWGDDEANRRKYQAFVRHGLAGFNQEELAYLDNLQNAIQKAKGPSPKLSEDDYVIGSANQKDDAKPEQILQRSRSAFQVGSGSDLMGFLEHAEESIVEVEGTNEAAADQ